MNSYPATCTRVLIRLALVSTFGFSVTEAQRGSTLSALSYGWMFEVTQFGQEKIEMTLRGRLVNCPLVFIR